MNNALAEQLKAEGFLTGLPETTVRGQFDEMRREGARGHDTLRTICVDLSIGEARKGYRELRDKIEDTAFSIGLTLLLRAEEDPHLHILRGRRHRGKRFLEEHQDEESEDDGLQGVLGHFVSSGSDTDSGMLCTRNKKCVHTKRTAHSAYRTKVSKVPLPSPNSGRSGLTTPRTDQRAGTDVRVKAVPSFQRVSETGNKLQRAPRLLYRWYNSESQGLNTPNQLRAGRFVDASCQIPTPEWDIESVSNHLIPEKKPSPFISFRDEMRPCMVHALHANENSNAYLTIIDFQSFLTASRQRLGDDSAARYCPTLVKRFALKLGRKGTYTGRGEWLLYGIVSFLFSILVITIGSNN